MNGRTIVLPATEVRIGMLIDGAKVTGIRTVYATEPVTIEAVLMTTQHPVHGTNVIVRLPHENVAIHGVVTV